MGHEKVKGAKQAPMCTADMKTAYPMSLGLHSRLKKARVFGVANTSEKRSLFASGCMNVAFQERGKERGEFVRRIRWIEKQRERGVGGPVGSPNKGIMCQNNHNKALIKDVHDMRG